MKFGDKLREARKNKGLTQLELSKLAGVSIRTIINYEPENDIPKNANYIILWQRFLMLM